jgi:aspartate racemase
MKTIGLIGGMSWESTAIYYRLINEHVRDRLGGLHSAEIFLRSLDFDAVVALQRADRWDAAADLLGNSARALADAGADCVLICTNTMHLVADSVAQRVDVPLLNIIDETGRAVAAAGCRRPLLLATRYTMEQGFYVKRMQARHGVEALIPDGDDRALVHAVIFDELCRGIVREDSRRRLLEIVARGRAKGADSVILGCTEICLILDPAGLPCPAFDSTAIHARSAVDFALAGSVRDDQATAA